MEKETRKWWRGRWIQGWQKFAKICKHIQNQRTPWTLDEVFKLIVIKLSTWAKYWSLYRDKTFPSALASSRSLGNLNDFWSSGSMSGNVVHTATITNTELKKNVVNQSEISIDLCQPIRDKYWFVSTNQRSALHCLVCQPIRREYSYSPGEY